MSIEDVPEAYEPESSEKDQGPFGKNASILEVIRRSGQATFERADTLMNTRAVLLEGPEHAERLANRHNSLLISHEFIAFMEACSAHPNREVLELARQQMLDDGIDPTLVTQFLQDKIGKREFRAHLTEGANKFGFFIQRYSPELEAQRLTSGEYVIGETYADLQGKKSIAVADCQVHLPREDVATAIFDLPSMSDDQVNNDFYMNLILTNPSHFACEEDIATHRAANDKRGASLARSTAYGHIAKTINPQRGADHQISYAMAMIALLRGVRKPDGSETYFTGTPHGGLFNNRSLTTHESSRFGAHRAFTLNNRTVPYVLGGENYEMLVQWQAYVQHVNPQK